jgi:hypothetical protein
MERSTIRDSSSRLSRISLRSIRATMRARGPPPKNQKAGPGPAVLNAARCAGCPGGARLHPGFRSLLLLRLLGLLRLLCLLRFLSHSILSEFNGWKRDTRHARRRASLATSSNAIPTDSEARAPHCHVAVIALSTAVMHFWCVFVPSMRSALQKIARASDHRAASTGLTMRQRGEAPCIDPALPRRIQVRTRQSSSIHNQGADCSAAVRVR